MKHLYFMLTIIYFFLFDNQTLSAQTYYFSDTLYNALNPNNSAAIGVNAFETATGYAIAPQTSTNPSLTLYHTDTGGSFSYEVMHTVSSNPYSYPMASTSTRLKRNRWLIPIVVEADTPYNQWEGIAVFDKNLNTVLSSNLYQFHYQGIDYKSFFLHSKTSIDSNSIWLSGRVNINNSHYSGTLTHIDTSFNIISQYCIDGGTKSLFPISLLPTTDNKCLVGGIASPLTNTGSFRDQNFIAKLSDSGVEWYKEFGNTTVPDGGGFLFKGLTDTSFWFVYTKGQTVDSLSGGTIEPIVCIRALLFTTSGIELQNKALNRNWPYSYHQVGIQLTDNSVILGYLKADYGRQYFGFFQKFSPNMELIWESEAPLPPTLLDTIYPYINPLDIKPTSDGGFICTGQYHFHDTGLSRVWIGKMDGDGCWDVGCSTVTATASPNPSKGGELLRVCPNPAKDYFVVELNNCVTEYGMLKIYNLLGQEVFSSIIDKANQDLTIRTSTWSSGTYFYRYSIADKTLQSGKIEVIK